MEDTSLGLFPERTDPPAPHYNGHRDCLRERFLKACAQNLSA